LLDQHAKNTRLIFREFNSTASLRLPAMPTGEPLDEGIFLLSSLSKTGRASYREEFRSRSNNDAKIIELAKVYNKRDSRRKRSE
jgi:hypothetical protein